ncbi:hypothetical protein SAY86_002866 [Trapa natans]|uniref:Uncharacterized protein n=1 Tax=Trapa natans TaxID=22666 RepID=A0AAN7LGE1_TRANT|nr:hypothetical protein SAY86_002866 [Trapa natans]
MKEVSIVDFTFHCPKVIEDTTPEYAERKASSVASSNRKMKTSMDNERRII